MNRKLTIVLAASLGASCGDYGAYGVEFGAPAYEASHDELYYRDSYGWYYRDGGWLWTPSPGHGPDHWNYERYPWYYQPAPAPQPREEPQQRAPQAPLPPPPGEPAPQADDDSDRDPK